MTAGAARPAALEADHLCRRFRGVTAVADVSLRVAAGARFGIIGPNGAGKTTLFNLLSGELRPTTGSVALFGRDITALRTYRRRTSSASMRREIAGRLRVENTHGTTRANRVERETRATIRRPNFSRTNGLLMRDGQPQREPERAAQ